MKFSRAAGLLWFALLGATIETQALSLNPVEVDRGVYAFIGETGGRTYENEGMNANTGFIVTSAGVVVIDSGSSHLAAQAMHEAIRRVTPQPVRYVINTGGQDHRWLGNGYFAGLGAEIIASRKARADMEARGAAQIEDLRPSLREKLDGTKPAYPTRMLERGETLKLGGEEIRVLFPGGGHTPGDSLVWLPQRRILFSGDIVYVDRLLGVLPVSSTKHWLASFEEIEKLAPRIIVPGHGGICDLAKARRETKDYLLLLRGHMKKAIDAGLDLQKAIDTLDQDAFKHLENFQALKGGNASRTYLEMEGE